jgi:hypothetical protein
MSDKYNLFAKRQNNFPMQSDDEDSLLDSEKLPRKVNAIDSDEEDLILNSHSNGKNLIKGSRRMYFQLFLTGSF